MMVLVAENKILFVYTYVCVYTIMYVSMSVCMYVCMYVCMPLPIYYMYVGAYMYVSILSM